MNNKMKDFLQDLVGSTKTKIEHLVSVNLDNKAKKEALDNYVRDWVVAKLQISSFNVLTKWLIQKIIIDNISVITQFVFDLLKENIHNLTKKGV